MTYLLLIGALGLFLYGLQLMSEGLQKIAGDQLRNIQSSMRGNSFKGVLAGLVITILVQSSAATTLMAVSFVNAGLLSLAESLAVIMGANVGTTATAWLLSLIGFQPDLPYLGLMAIALSFPLINAHEHTPKAWCECLIGLGLLALSISGMAHCLPDLYQSSPLTTWLASFSAMGAVSVMGFFVLGLLLTMLLQTSSATFIIAALLCYGGFLPFEMGCALLIGANVGSCIIPLFATRSANLMAKHAAYGHSLFNIFGAVWALACFPWFCSLISQLASAVGLGDPHETGNAVFGLALYHTSFNLINLCLLSPFCKYIATLINKLSKEPTNANESFKLKYIDGNFMASAGEMALVQVQKEVGRYAQETYRMFTMVRQMLTEPMGTEKQYRLVEAVKHMEEDSDEAELEIAQFLNKLSPHTLSNSGEQLSRSLYKIVDELESIADALRHCSESLYQKSEQRVKFSTAMNTNINKMFALTDDALHHMVNMLQLEEIPGNALDKAYNYEDEINNFRNQMRNEMLDSIDRKEIAYEQNTYFMQLINECEKIGDYAINVMAAAML